MKIVIFWFRRDLRLTDNTALYHALKAGLPVMPVFIFDKHILDDLSKDDARVTFIYQTLKKLDAELRSQDSSLQIWYGDPLKVWQQLIRKYKISEVYINKDYEPYAIERDRKIFNLLKINVIPLSAYKDQVIFEENDILKNDGKPYTVFTPYKRKWLEHFNPALAATSVMPDFYNFYKDDFKFPRLEEIGFEESNIKVKEYDLSNLDNYQQQRDLPAEDATSYISPHLRFGTISIRQLIQKLQPQHDLFLSELIWREFFMQILYHFPSVIKSNFKSRYNGIGWRNNKTEFDLWCQGKTGFPMVDAGMRQLNQTGYMHNRVRMITAGFLTKHLLIHWSYGEKYFSRKLLDYELSSNNGNWQWAAGTGCDAAPYFRIFNPIEQLKKFDKNLQYVKRWIPEIGTADYPEPIVEHKYARIRALDTYRSGMSD